MTDRPPPTPISAASLRSAQDTGNGVQGFDLHNYLQTVAQEATLSGEIEHGTDAMSLIDELSEHVLANFPRHGPGIWNTVYDKIRLCSATLDVIQRMASRTAGTFCTTDPRAIAILSRIIDFMSILWGWPASTSARDPDVDSVLELRLRAARALGALSISFDQSEKQLLLRSVLASCDKLCDDFSAESWPKEHSMHIVSSNGSFEIKFKVESVDGLGNALQDLLWSLFPAVEHCLQQGNQMVASALQRYTSLLRRIHVNLQTSSNLLSSSSRCIALATLVKQAYLFRALLPQAEKNTVASIPTHILISRLRQSDGVNDWVPLDEALAEAFATADTPIFPASCSVLITELSIQSESDTMQKIKVVVQSALQKVLPTLPPRYVESINILLSGCQDTAFDALKASAIASQQKSAPVAASPLLGKRKRADQSWRSRVDSTLRPAIFQVNEDLGLSGNTMSDNDWIGAVLEQVRQRLACIVRETPSDLRVQAALALKHLACRIAHPKVEKCKESLEKQEQALSLLPSYIASVKSLIGESVARDPEVGRAALDALAMGIRHHSQGFREETHESVFTLIVTSLKARNRSVRLAAGRALKALVSLYERIGPGTRIRRYIKSVFIAIEEILNHEGDQVKETTLISLGALGRNPDSGVLENVLFILFSQLDCSSILLKGISYMQLVALASFYKKKPYALVSPHLQRITIFIVDVMSHQPNALLETCRFLSLSPKDFLSATLPYSLPHLFGTCNAHALEALHREIGRPLSSLLLNHSSEILAHVFLLEGTRRTDKAMDYILDTLNEAASDAISVANLVKSCMMPLLGNLIIAMGDLDSSQSDAAKHAIRKVERCVSDPEGDRNGTAQHLGNFLKNYILGIIAILNEILQEVRGRKSNEVKCKVLSGLGALIQEVGPAVIAVAPQIMATLQTTLNSPVLASTSLQTWNHFLRTLSLSDLGQYVGQTTAALVNSWPSLTPFGRDAAKGILNYIFTDVSVQIDDFANEIADLSSIPELADFARKLRDIRSRYTITERLQRILNRMESDNQIVIRQALEELRTFMLQVNPSIIVGIVTGDVFHPLAGLIIKTLLAVICRETEEADSIRLIAFECLGILGAADPDRFSIAVPDRSKVVVKNYADEEEAIQFALYLIENILVSAYRSTSDIKYQSHVAFVIQELLKFCKFTPSLAFPGHGPSSSLKTRNRWNLLPKHVLETVTPLLESRFSAGNSKEPTHVEHPIYRVQETYREWLQLWVGHLISRTSGSTARTVFEPFRLAIRNKDVGVARQLLPHLVLNVLLSGPSSDTLEIKEEIVSILEDQIDEDTLSAPEKRLLSAQAIFMLMDHLNKWLRIARQTIISKLAVKKKGQESEILDMQISVDRVGSLLGEIDHVLIAKAAFHCQSYARSLMNFEKQIIKEREEHSPQDKLQPYYERLHEIYSHLDEPDGMEGISDFIVLPSLEHQIRQHESTGKWTSAQSCWEVRLQQDPDKLDYHLGLVRCLRNLGHYDSLRTHIQGILVRNPDWEPSLAGFRIEGAWMNDDWESVRRYAENGEDNWETSIARILLAMREGNDDSFAQATKSARLQLGKPVIAGGEAGYRRSYDAVLKLHVVRDIECVRNATRQLQKGASKSQVLPNLFALLSQRTAATLPNFRTREPLLSVHRIAFSLSNSTRAVFKRAVGRAWLDSAKLARKAGHWQTAYSAVLQAQESHEPLTFYQSAKLVKETGEPLRALHELDNALQIPAEKRQMLTQGVIDLSEDMDLDDAERKRVEAKARLLRARWMRESERFDANIVAKELHDLSRELKYLESAHFHAGHFQDENFKRLGSEKYGDRGQRMNVFTVKEYVTAVELGSKFAYQTIPRVLTLWLDMGENVGTGKLASSSKSKKSDKSSSSQGSNSADSFSQINDILKSAIKKVPIYKWLSAFPQIVSRVDHINIQAYETLSSLILLILREYPQQGLWSFISVLNSTNWQRKERGREIFNRLRQSAPISDGVSVADLVISIDELAKQLLHLCNFPVQTGTKSLSLSNNFRGLARLAPSPLIIPLQESMTVTFPSSSSAESVHQPFPIDAPTIERFDDEVIVMNTLAKPRRISLKGSDGRTYLFLGKPKDDLRKDARLMDFNSIINKLLKTNSDSRRRQLHIRTYSVVTLNEECGFIQWVPNTSAIRSLIVPYYTARGIQSYDSNIRAIYEKMRTASEKEATDIFENKILKIFPPVFHEWFLDTFPEPSTWLSARLAYGRTIAVMSMVGFILGLGDRHLENILLDVHSGDAVHVDFNCLFEKGKLLEIPERTPFRLTQNLIDALGVTGVEGVFRKAAEITMQLLRDNKDVLMSVLDAFIHDPLVEWEDERRKQERRRRGDPQGGNEVKQSVNLRSVAKLALVPIEKKLKGVYSKDANNKGREKESTTSNLVQALIEEATDSKNLSKMYIGWSAFH